MNQPTIPFSLESLWAMEPAAFERLRDLVMTSSHERLAAASAQSAAGSSYEKSGSTAIINFSGVVAKKPTIWSRIFGGNAVISDAQKNLGAALADDSVKNILLVIDSPGGAVDGVGDFADAVAAANKIKPVTAYAEDMMASAAYWIGSQAGRLVGNKTATVGSIGVFTTVADVSRLAKNMGVEVNVVKSVAGKGAGTLGTPVTETQLAELQKMVDAIHAEFVGAVSAGRGRDMSSVSDGRVYVGQAAVKAGLLDAIEPLATTLAGMQPAPEPVVTQEPVTVQEEPMPEPVTVVDHTADIAAITERLKAQDEKLASLSGAVTSKDIDAAIAQARTDRKLTPALEKSARLVAKSGGLEALNEFLGTLPATATPGGSVVEDKPLSAKEPEPRNPSDHVGVNLGAYKQETAPAHQAAIAFMEKSAAQGRKISYYDAVVAVTRR